MPHRPHSDYLDGTDPDPVDFLLQVVVPSSPQSAARGDILVTVIERGVDQWAGVWRLDTGEWDGEWRRFRQLETCFGTRAELVHWARARDAATRWIFDEESSDFVPLDQTVLAKRSTRSWEPYLRRAASHLQRQFRTLRGHWRDLSTSAVST